MICQLNLAGQKLDIHHPDTSGLFSLERRRREALCIALRIWRHCHNIDVKLIPLLTAADQLPAECKNHSDTTDYCHIVTCHRVITHGAEEPCVCVVITVLLSWQHDTDLLRSAGPWHWRALHTAPASTAAAQLRKQTPCATRSVLPATTPHHPVLIRTSLALYSLHTIMTWSHFTQ